VTVADFFAFARERHAVYLRRAAGQPRPWTQDPVLQRYRFTNVFRELDATTQWFRTHVRDQLRSSPDALLATVLFRWFNRVATGEAMFCQEALGLGGELPEETAWQAFLRGGAIDVSILQANILNFCGDGPYVTGAYIIKTPDGLSKLEGVLQCVEWFCEQRHDIITPQGDVWSVGWRELAEALLMHRLEDPGHLESVWSWLRQFPYMGDFMSYEVVTDLRHTDLLDRAPDIMTWANPGPGARRGLGRVFEGGAYEALGHKKEPLVRMMRELLEVSRDPEHWPQFSGPGFEFAGEGLEDRLLSGYGDWWPTWEMRDVEHTLCEFDKYERARLGQGKPKQVYR